jgi:flagellar M-ring protein FliF
MSEIALDEGTLSGSNFDAEVNVPVNVPNAQTSSADQGNGSLPASIEKSAIEKFIDQPAVRRAFPAVSGLVVLLFCVFFYMWISAPGYRAVYPGMMESDRQVAFELLKNSGFDVYIDTSSGELQVTNDRYHEARMTMAAQNIPKTSALGSVGSLVEQGSLTTSRFMEQVSYRAAMESELAKSVEQIGSISSARVHIAESQQSVFVRNKTASKASVVVRPYPGRSVSRSQIQAIVHLVSSSVPYLDRENVTIVDDLGQLLTDSESDLAFALTAAQSEHKKGIESEYENRVQQLVSAIVGLGNVRTEVDVSVNFTEVESTFEEYDRGGNGPSTRSESLQFERDRQASSEGVPGSVSNQPPADPSFAETRLALGTSSGDSTDVSSRSTTRNYELDREIRYVKQQVGAVERLSVAVVINENIYQNENEEIDQERLERQVARMGEVVRGAIGYNEERGDVVTVVSSAFAKPVEELETLAWYLQPDKLDGYIRLLAVFVALLFIYFTMVRPFLRELKTKAEMDMPLEDIDDDGLTDEERELVNMGDLETIQDVTARLKPKPVGIPAEYLDTSQPYDQKVALMRFLVKDDVGRVSNLLKRWVEE